MNFSSFVIFEKTEITIIYWLILDKGSEFSKLIFRKIQHINSTLLIYTTDDIDKFFGGFEGVIRSLSKYLNDDS